MANEKRYTKHDLISAKRVTELQEQLFWPATSILERYLQNGPISNCDLKVNNIKTRNEVYGETYQVIQGKAIRSQLI